MQNSKKRPRTASTESTKVGPARKEQRTEDNDSSSRNAPIAGASWNTTNISGVVNNVNGDQFIVYETNDSHLATKFEERLKVIHDTYLAKDIHRWLSPPDSSSNYNEARKKHLLTTCSWFIDGVQFTEWKEKADLILWVYGNPGCGKTILCSSAIENIINFCESKPLVSYAYFFFDSRNSQNELILHEMLIRSLISQFSDQCGGTPAVLVNVFGNGHRQPSIDSLQDTLQRILEGFDHTYLIIDSLDECAERFQLLEWIQKIARRQSGKLHLLVTSRKERDIEEGLNSIFGLRRVVISGESATGDIAAYLNAKLSKMRQWKDETRLEIKDALMKGADGMFRWVALQLDELRNCPSRRAVREQLKMLPRDLEGIYERILSRSAHSDQLKAFLQWLAFSTRDMTVAEIAEVACVDLVARDGPIYDIDLQYDDPQYILIVCSGLITEFRGTVKLAHFSVKEYLISERIQKGAATNFSTSERLSHSVIAQTCLAYLLHFDKLDSITHKNIWSFPLAKYAAQNWIFHNKSVGDDSMSVLQRLIMNLFRPESEPFINWVRLHNIDEPWDRDLAKQSADMATPLYYASLAGLQYGLEKLLAKGAEINAEGGIFGNALQAAIAGGHETIARLLIENGAEVNAQGGPYGSALQAASEGGHEAIVRLLIERGAEVNAQGGLWENALYAASRVGHETIARLLIENGAEVNAQGGPYGNALQAASEGGHEAIARLLIKNGAEVNAQGGLWENALYAASRSGHEGITRLLIENGAEVNTQGGPYGTALQAASLRGHEAIARLLIDKGAEVNAQGRLYGSAVQAAHGSHHPAIVRLLIEKGAEVDEWQRLHWNV